MAALVVGMYSSNNWDPAVVRMPAVSKRSLCAIGMPTSDPFDRRLRRHSAADKRPREQGRNQVPTSHVGQL